MLCRPTLLLLFLLTLAGSAGLCAATQPDPRHLDASAFGERVDVSKSWLFSPDDRPEYASPAFKDSGWKTISTDEELLSYGFQDFPFCWYRLHARIPPGARGAVAVQNTFGAYEVFVNGVRIGGMGDMASHALQTQNALAAYPIPTRVLAAAHGELVLAMRFSTQARHYRARSLTDPIGPFAGVYLESEDAAGRDLNYRNSRLVAVEMLEAVLELLIGLVALALFFALRSQQEYLAVALVLLAGGLGACFDICSKVFTGWMIYYVAVAVLNAVAAAATIEFVRLILHLPRSRFWTAMQIVAVIGPLSNPLALSGFAPVWVVFATIFLSLIVMDLLLPALLLRGGWRGNLDARVLLPAILMGFFADYYGFALNAIFFLHLSRTLHQMWALHIGGYRLDVGDFGNLAFNITILLFIVLRTIRIARERARAAGEIEAAQTTQQLLLARASQVTPGFTVESVYLPASEVGGDFFLVSSGPDGSLIAIVGDVSGKGLLAAMRVSMILGVLRREDSREPAEILSQLNAALLTQGEMGFTTACCVRLERSGQYEVANAGHIPPYSEGLEIATPPGLPLGLVADTAYEGVVGRLSPGQKLVLMSDGVVEARSAKGELYGFDRLPGLTRMPAVDIAEIAQRFGQEDDITVLTVACL